ncbi:MAG: phosphatase [Clostridia bacterium]|nr:phosphatase [Clostridia bacterium]
MDKSLQEDRANALRREYMRAWRARNKQRVQRYNREYWSRRAEAERKQKLLLAQAAERVDYDG